MSLGKQKNLYLKKIYPNSLHKYRFKEDTGKHYILTEDGTERTISKIGTFKPKFRQHFSGFANSQERNTIAKEDTTAAYSMPLSTHKKSCLLYTPVTRKFFGYAQQPFKISNKKEISFLHDPEQQHNFKNRLDLKKSESQNLQKIKLQNRKTGSLILQHSARTFMGTKINNSFYQNSFQNQTNRHILPRKTKKSCYNYHCKYLKHFNFEEGEKIKTMLCSTMFGGENSETKSKSFYDSQIELEKQQLCLLKSTYI